MPRPTLFFTDIMESHATLEVDTSSEQYSRLLKQMAGAMQDGCSIQPSLAKSAFDPRRRLLPELRPAAMIAIARATVSKRGSQCSIALLPSYAPKLALYALSSNLIPPVTNANHSKIVKKVTLKLWPGWVALASGVAEPTTRGKMLKDQLSKATRVRL